MRYAKYNHEIQSGYVFTSVAHLYKRQKAGQEKKETRFYVSLVISDTTYFVLMKHGNLSIVK